MKTLNWNLGILLIRFGYLIRKYDFQPKSFNFRWFFGREILKIGYSLRGEIPMKNWSW